jgi:hypothetical protein
MTNRMNAPRAEANKSMAEVEKTAVSLSGILTNIITSIQEPGVDIRLDVYVQCGLKSQQFFLASGFHGPYDTYLKINPR